MSGDGRRAATLALALLFAAPSLGEGETLNETYRRVSTSVVVIRARGQEVTAEGTVTLQGDRLGRADLAGREGGDRRACGPDDGGHHRGVPRRGAGARARHLLRAMGRHLDHPGLGGAARRHGGEARRLRPRRRRRSGLHRRRALRSELFAEPGGHQRAVGPQHGHQGLPAGRVLPDRRGDQYRQLRRADVHPGGRADRDHQPQHHEVGRERRARLRRHLEYREEACWWSGSAGGSGSSSCWCRGRWPRHSTCRRRAGSS